MQEISISLLLKSVILSFNPSPVTLQVSLCRTGTWLATLLLTFFFYNYRFTIPIAFQQTNRPVPLEYTLNTHFQLHNNEMMFLQNPFTSVYEFDDMDFNGAFSEGKDLIYSSLKQRIQNKFRYTQRAKIGRHSNHWYIIPLLLMTLLVILYNELTG